MQKAKANKSYDGMNIPSGTAETPGDWMRWLSSSRGWSSAVGSSLGSTSRARAPQTTLPTKSATHRTHRREKNQGEHSVQRYVEILLNRSVCSKESRAMR